MLYDKGIKTVVGIDFSEVGIKMAKEKVPSYTFITADLRNIDYNKYVDYTFVSTETFEHLENDIELIKKLPKNHMIFSVPNYMCADHYRTYNNEDFIIKYYENILKIENIKSFSMGFLNDTESIIYVVECNIK
jgi:trans-aconitate methyltransferase